MSENRNQVGRNSLIISIVGLIVVQILIYFGYLQNPFWHILLSGFEAATIGGFADWFAVSALFHEIPIPVVRKHTNIIVRNRKKLTEGVVDLVTNKWLSPEIITEKISDVPIIKNVITTLKDQDNSTRLVHFFKEIIGRLVTEIDSPNVIHFLQSAIKKQVKEFDIVLPLGKWLKSAIEKGHHNVLWEMILEAATNSIYDSSTQEILLKFIEKHMQDYKDENFFKRLIIGVAKGVGAIRNETIADKILKSIIRFLEEAKDNPEHPVRQKFDDYLLRFAEKLISGDEEAANMINELQNNIVDNANAKKVIESILKYFKETVRNMLDGDDHTIDDFLQQNVDKLIHELETDEATQLKIDQWLKGTIEKLITNHHHEIGEMVRLSLSKLNDEELVKQLEEKVGNDLQFIRLNGAVVGGFVGVIISFIRIVIL